MKKKCFAAALGVLIAFAVLVNAPSASAVSWTNWTSITTGTSGSGSGEMTIGTSTVDVTLSGLLYGFSDGDFYYKNYPATYGYLYPSDLIIERYTGTVTLTFSTALVNPYISLVSVGQSYSVNYNFQNLTGDINVISYGDNAWGYIGYSIDGSVFTGNEFNGVLQLMGTYSSLTFTISPDEYWHGFNIGADSVYTGVPEPATLILLGFGFLGLAGVRRKFRK